LRPKATTMMNHSNTFAQNMGSQDWRFFKKGEQRGGLNSSTNQSRNPLTAFLRALGPAPAILGGIGISGMGNDSGMDNSNPVATAMMKNASQMNAMNNFNVNDLKRLQRLPLQQQFQNQFQNQLLQNQQNIQASKFDYFLCTSLGMTGVSGLSGQPPMLDWTILPECFMMNHNAMNGDILSPTIELPLSSPCSLPVRGSALRMRGGVLEPFPEKLHRLLLEVEAAGQSDVISFVANGQAFAIHKPDKFFAEIVPLYFRHTRLSSFKRQLNLYEFEFVNTPGPARGGYYHYLFVKQRPELCRRIRRIAIKSSPKKGTPNSGITKEREF
jgi:hypothetical protein